MKVCVIGLGEVGLPTALYVKEKGLELRGYDISEKAVLRAKENGILASKDESILEGCDVYIICVWTGLNNNKPDMSAVFEVSEKIAKNSYKKALISIESTLAVGTCREVYEKYLKGNFLVHVPHRYWKGDPVRYGVRQKRVIGAIDDASMKEGLRFYREILDIPVHSVSKIEIAELSKIAENAYRFVNIAFAEELRMISEALDLSFDELRNACNTKWNVNILEAKEGIGGHCLPKDVRYLFGFLKEKSLIKSAVDVDEIYKEWYKEKYKK